MVRDFQMSSLSTTGYIKEHNLVYVTAGHRLLLWDYLSSDEWVVYDKIIGNIKHVCSVDKKSPLNGSCTFDLVVVTSTEVLLLGVICNNNKVR